MREERSIMGMPVRLEIVDVASPEAFERVFSYLRAIDERFSTYKKDSEVSRLNRGLVREAEYSPELREILTLAEETKGKTNGYFDVRTPEGNLDPSGLVKGWAINKAAQFLRKEGYENFYLEIAGDIQTAGHTAEGKEWSIGIRNPFDRNSIVKVLYPRGKGIATSGTYERGAHIYDPHGGNAVGTYPSLTVIGPDIYEADRFATAAFAMGEDGLLFIESLPGFEAYAINNGRGYMTSGLDFYTKP